MKKTPSALKWLAETRARVSGQLQSAQATCELVRQQVASAEEKLASLRALESICDEQVTKRAKALEALDGSVVIFDKSIQPKSIGTIKAWAGRYGKRGALREYLHEVIKSRAPEFVSTSELGVRAVMEFSLVFAHYQQRRTWFRNSLRNALVALEQNGHIERSLDACEIIGGGTEVRGWRCKQESLQTLAELRAQSLQSQSDEDGAGRETR